MWELRNGKGTEIYFVYVQEVYKMEWVLAGAYGLCCTLWLTVRLDRGIPVLTQGAICVFVPWATTVVSQNVLCVLHWSAIPWCVGVQSLQPWDASQSVLPPIWQLCGGAGRICLWRGFLKTILCPLLQKYLTSLRKEKEAFQQLIKERAVSVNICMHCEWRNVTRDWFLTEVYGWPLALTYPN